MDIVQNFFFLISCDKQNLVLGVGTGWLSGKDWMTLQIFTHYLSW